MMFETEAEALVWYEGQERVLTPGFLGTIPWKDVKNHEIAPELVPVLFYMRDVENFTGIYYDELMRTPTVKDPAVRNFMDRWRTEEPVHGNLLNRFLEEAGVPTSAKWVEEARAKIPDAYTRSARRDTLITNLFGEHFAAVHMTWGAINELSTLTGYERLWQMAKHPVLEMILRAIAREEARHAFFYWSVARMKLARSRFRQALARFVISRFWSPVGQGAKPADETNRVIAALFKGEEGVRMMDLQVNRRLERLPGFEGVKTVTDRIAGIALA